MKYSLLYKGLRRQSGDETQQSWAGAHGLTDSTEFRKL